MIWRIATGVCVLVTILETGLVLRMRSANMELVRTVETQRQLIQEQAVVSPCEGCLTRDKLIAAFKIRDALLAEKLSGVTSKLREATERQKRLNQSRQRLIQSRRPL